VCFTFGQRVKSYVQRMIVWT